LDSPARSSEQSLARPFQSSRLPCNFAFGQRYLNADLGLEGGHVDLEHGRFSSPEPAVTECPV
jgi:hypothetical protein